MLDTVRMTICGNYRADAEGTKGDLPTGWTSKEYVAFDQMGHARGVRNVQHVDTGLRIMGSTCDADEVEVSLPRVLHGDNGRLLATPEDLGQAVQKTMDLLGSVLDRPRVSHFTRCDLVWQFEGDPLDWINALRRAKHPRVRKAGHEFFDESLHWPGKEVHGRLYDKGKECGKDPGKIVRFEWQLRGSALAKALGTEGKVRMAEVLDFKREYSEYRKLVTAFERRVLVKPRGLAEFFVYCDTQGWVDENGRNALAVYSSSKSDRTKRRLLLDYQRAKFGDSSVVVLDLGELLPLDHPPRVVNVA